MKLSKLIRPVPVLFLFLILVLAAWFRQPLWDALATLAGWMKDDEKIRQIVSSFGIAAPVVFIFFQILQVVLAPVPGEISGFVGGYLFGTINGFLLSSFGLTVGSWINFSIGRYVGRRWVRRLIPGEKRERMDRFVRRQGVLAIFALFVFPGFPKDYFCIALGMSKLPLKMFIVLAGIGRMPGTLLLSLQGSAVYSNMHAVAVGVFIFCLVAVIAGYIYRDRLYAWVERLENHQDPDN